jgi:hypothetical protein
MALARCKQHPPDRSRSAFPYSAFACPIGYPKTAVICGRGDCEEPAVLWLTRSEQADHGHGCRIFADRAHTAKIRASDEPLQKRKRR